MTGARAVRHRQLGWPLLPAQPSTTRRVLKTPRHWEGLHSRAVPVATEKLTSQLSYVLRGIQTDADRENVTKFKLDELIGRLITYQE